jgi:hypothetical protein
MREPGLNWVPAFFMFGLYVFENNRNTPKIYSLYFISMLFIVQVYFIGTTCRILGLISRTF